MEGEFLIYVTHVRVTLEQNASSLSPRASDYPAAIFIATNFYPRAAYAGSRGTQGLPGSSFSYITPAKETFIQLHGKMRNLRRKQMKTRRLKCS